MKIYKNNTIQTKKTKLQEFCELNQFRTDKYTLHRRHRYQQSHHIGHDYVNQYYGYEFNEHRESNLKMLEIGLHHGGSIDMFKQWMPNLEMHGIDFNPVSFAFCCAKINTNDNGGNWHVPHRHQRLW